MQYELTINLPDSIDDVWYMQQLYLLSGCHTDLTKELVSQLMFNRWPNVWKAYNDLCKIERRSFSSQERYSYLTLILKGQIQTHELFPINREVENRKKFVELLLSLSDGDPNLAYMKLTDYGLLCPN